jgi:hypothetical protein
VVPLAFLWALFFSPITRYMEKYLKKKDTYMEGMSALGWAQVLAWPLAFLGATAATIYAAVRLVKSQRLPTT